MKKHPYSFNEFFFKENKEEKKAYNECVYYLACMTEQRNKLKTALEEIRILATKNVSIENFVKIQNKINEVLNDSEG